MTNDLVGAAFLALLLIGAILGLRALAKPRPRTAEEFERNAAEGATALGSSMNALQELMNPEAAKAREVIAQMKDGRYQKKKREGKAGGSIDGDDLTENEDER